MIYDIKLIIQSDKEVNAKCLEIKKLFEKELEDRFVSSADSFDDGYDAGYEVGFHDCVTSLKRERDNLAEQFKVEPKKLTSPYING